MVENRISIRLNAIRYEAEGINSYELVDPAGVPLPPFEVGAHIHLQLDERTVRQYSLSQGLQTSNIC